MRMRFVSPLLALLAVVGLAACSGAPSPGSTGSVTEAPSSSAASSTPTATGSAAPTSQPTTPGQGNAELSIALLEAPDAALKAFTLVCTAGTPAAESDHPSAAEACTAIKDNPALLSPAPTKTDQACTMQYGGPATAKVTGSVDGKEVTAAFSRTDGCQIALWDAAKSVLGSDGGL